VLPVAAAKGEGHSDPLSQLGAGTDQVAVGLSPYFLAFLLSKLSRAIVDWKAGLTELLSTYIAAA